MTIRNELPGGANQADRFTVVAAAVLVVAVRGVEMARIEAQVVRVAARVARSRPIEAT